MPFVPEPDYSLRPITIKIIEEETGKPLPGIQVLHVFETDIYGSCWSLFKYICATGSNYIGRLAVANEFGVITFKQHVYDFTCNEYPYKEYLIINLDLRPEAYEKNKWITEDKIESLMQLISPNENYKKNIMAIDANYRGKIIYGNPYEIKSPSDWWHGNFGFFDVEVNTNGFSGGPETIVAKLRKQQIQTK